MKNISLIILTDEIQRIAKGYLKFFLTAKDAKVLR